MEILFQTGNREKWSSQKKCLEYGKETEELIKCYQVVEEKSILPLQLTFRVGSILKGSEMTVDKDYLIESHNQACSMYPEAQIGF